jgi:microcystin-dependent protein
MADPFVAEIRMFPFNFAPKGWAWCDGQLLPISQNTALFALLGTTYGGDGKSNFALPNLQGSVPMHPDHRVLVHKLGEAGGAEQVTLLESEIPAHIHTTHAATDPAKVAAPGPERSLTRSSGARAYAPPSAGPAVTLSPAALAITGASLPHNNMQPYLTVYFCIAMQGVFPPRP